MATKPPAFQEYARDVLAEAELTLEEQGALRMLRSHAWLEGSIPADLERLARILRVSRKDVDRVYDAIAARVATGGPGRLVFPDLERQRKEKADYSQLQRDKANQKWEQERSKHAAACAPAYPAAHAARDATAPPTADPPEEAAACAPAYPAGKPQRMPGDCSASDSASSLASSEELTHTAHAHVEPESTVAADEPSRDHRETLANPRESLAPDLRSPISDQDQYRDHAHARVEPEVEPDEHSQLSEYDLKRATAARFAKLWNQVIESPAPTLSNVHALIPVVVAIQESRLVHQEAGKPFPADLELARGLFRYAKSEYDNGFHGAWQPKSLIGYIPHAVLVALGELDPAKRPTKSSAKPAEPKPAYHRPAKLGYSD